MSLHGSSVQPPHHTPTFADKANSQRYTLAFNDDAHMPANKCCVTFYLSDRLNRSYVRVWAEQDVLQLRLLLIDSLH